jgi:UDP-N-acetyl-D-mannosaminuronic acid dehydrogenase/UDP-N-acetyl-D-glucosamine dehydrogenase
MVTGADVPEFVQLVECTPEVVAESDIVVVLTDHDDVDWELIGRHADRVLDTRNRLEVPGVDRL